MSDRARSFGEDADAYDRFRPGSPPALVGELADGGGVAPDLLGDVVLGLVGGDGPLAGIDETGAGSLTVHYSTLCISAVRR